MSDFSKKMLLSIFSFGLSIVSGYITYRLIKIAAESFDPTLKDEKQNRIIAEKRMRQLGIQIDPNSLSKLELSIACNLVDPAGISNTWEDIGGLDSTIADIQETVLIPFLNPDLFLDSRLYQKPRGLLLYGPPGCGKTMIARAIAKETKAVFINLKVETLFTMWFGETEKRLAALFSIAKKMQPSIIFIDEIDSLMRTREKSDHEVTNIVKTQFMTFLDGMTSNATNDRVLMIGATNRLEEVDPALLRRFSQKYYIGYPNSKQVYEILHQILSHEKVHSQVFLQLKEFSQVCVGLSGSDLNDLCRQAFMSRRRHFLSSLNSANKEQTSFYNESAENLEIRMEDLQSSLLKIRPSYSSANILLD